MTDHLLYLSRADVVAACTEVDPLECVHEALVMHARGQTRLPAEAYLPWEPPGGGRARSLNMPGLLAGGVRAAGSKIINANPRNIERGLPRASGLTVMFDYETARPVCVMDAAHVSGLRTAAVSTVAAMHLRAAAADTLGVIGAGVIARAHIDMIVRRIGGIERVVVHDREPATVGALRAHLQPLVSDTGVVVETAEAAVDAVRQADILVTATTTTTPYIHRSMLRPGVVAVNVSLDDLAEDVLLGADGLYVDDWHLIVDDQYRLLGHLARSGKVTGPGEPARPGARTVTGTLGELLEQRCPGRWEPGDVLIVNPFGMAVCDIAVARRVHGVAERRGLGVRLPY